MAVQSRIEDRPAVVGFLHRFEVDVGKAAVLRSPDRPPFDLADVEAVRGAQVRCNDGDVFPIALMTGEGRQWEAAVTGARA